MIGKFLVGWSNCHFLSVDVLEGDSLRESSSFSSQKKKILLKNLLLVPYI